MRFVRLATLVGIGALVVGCGSDGSSSDPTKDPTKDPTTDPATDPATDPSTDPDPNTLVPPSATFAALKAYQAFQGQAELTTQVSESVDKVELLVGEVVKATATTAPFTIAFDTTTADDGIAELSLRAHAGDKSADSTATPVVIYNGGTKATWKAGNGGEMWIQPGLDAHIKYHWDMPAGITRVLAILSWDNPEFQMDLAIGTGTCPHSGQEAKRVASETTPVVIDFSAGGMLSEVQWFAHASATNEAQLEGKKTNIAVEAFLF